MWNDEELLGPLLERRRQSDGEEQRRRRRRRRSATLGTGVPRRASVRARTPYMTAATSGRSELCHDGESRSRPSCSRTRLAPRWGRSYVRGGRSLDRQGRGGRRAAPGRRRVDGRRRVRRVRRPPPARRPAPARRLDRQRRHEADPRARARPPARRAAPTSPRTASTTCSRPAPTRSSCSTTSPPTAIELEQVAELVEGAAEVCRDGGLRAPRRRDGRAARDLPRRRARLRRHVRRARRARPAHRRLARRGGRRGDRLPVGGRARERLHARAARARARRTTTATTCSRRRGSTSTTSARCARAPTCARSRTSPAAASPATSRACSPTGSGRARLGRRGSARPSSSWLAGTSTRTSCAACSTSGIGYCAVVPAGDAGSGARDRQRRQRRDRRPRQRRGHEPAGAARRRPAGRRGRLEPADAHALERAAGAGVPTARLRARATTPTATRATRAMAAWLEAHGVELVVCAGYMHLLRPSFLDRFAGRIVNTHPAPLPAFPGAHPIEDVLAAGVPETGRDRPLRRRGRRHRPGDPRRSRCRFRPATPPRRCARGSRPSSTACCPRSLRELIAS